jgi:hypothetical protein
MRSWLASATSVGFDKTIVGILGKRALEGEIAAQSGIVSVVRRVIERGRSRQPLIAWFTPDVRDARLHRLSHYITKRSEGAT